MASVVRQNSKPWCRFRGCNETIFCITPSGLLDAQDYDAHQTSPTKGSYCTDGPRPLLWLLKGELEGTGQEDDDVSVQSDNEEESANESDEDEDECSSDSSASLSDSDSD